MIIRKLVFGTVLVLALGTTTVAFAKENRNQRQINKTSANTMYSFMEQYGYDDLSRDIKVCDYSAREAFMNNLSEEEYQKMIDYMKENGCGNMAFRMKRIDQDDTFSTRNTMRGSRGSVENALCQRRNQ